MSYSDVEKAVLAAALASGKTSMPVLVEQVSPEDFGHPAHQLIFHACSTLFRLGSPVDIVTVAEFLKDDGSLGDVGGRDYINVLALHHFPVSGLDWYCQKVREESVRRSLLTLGTEVAWLAEESPQEALQALQDGVNTLAGVLVKKAQLSTQELVAQALQSIREENDGQTRGPITGFDSLDQKQKGLSPGELVLVAARPGMGKSAFALNIASHVAFRAGQPVLFYSLEMEPVDLMTRILRSEAQTGYRMDQLSSVEVPDHYRLLDTPGLDAVRLKASILKNQSELGHIGLVVIDYLQLMQADGKSLYEKTTSISNALKSIARETKVPVLALSQLSRAVELRQDKRPILSDLRESGSLEQDADEVIFLYRHEYYFPGENQNEAEVILAKNRDGEVGTCKLLFRPGTSRFANPLMPGLRAVA